MSRHSDEESPARELSASACTRENRIGELFRARERGFCGRRRGKRICPPALHLSGALSVVSDVGRCRSRTRQDGPTQSNADRRVRETARESTSCQPRSHESAGCWGSQLLEEPVRSACRVEDVSLVCPASALTFSSYFPRREQNRVAGKRLT